MIGEHPDIEAVRPFVDAIRKALARVDQKNISGAAGALVGAGVGLMVGLGASEEEIHGLVEAMLRGKHVATDQIVKGGSA